MRGERLKKIVRKSFSISAVCFSMGILFFGISLSFFNIYFNPIYLVKMWIAFFILGVLSVFRLIFGETKWCKNKPFYVKNLIFMPFYLITAIVVVVDIIRDMGVTPSISLILIYAAIFMIAFTLRQIFQYFIDKAKTDKMNDALIEFQKEHKWDEEE